MQNDLPGRSRQHRERSSLAEALGVQRAHLLQEAFGSARRAPRVFVQVQAKAAEPGRVLSPQGKPERIWYRSVSSGECSGRTRRRGVAASISRRMRACAASASVTNVFAPSTLATKSGSATGLAP